MDSNHQSRHGKNSGILFEKDLERKIAKEMYHRFPGTNTIVCLLILENGYSLIGESSPRNSSNFNFDKGKQVSRRHAFSKIFALEGYLSRQVELEMSGNLTR